MNVFREVRQIEKIGEFAFRYAENGEFRKARRELKKIPKNSMCISECERAYALTEGKILERSGRRQEAKTRILNTIGYVWNRREAFEIIASVNPEVGEDSCLFTLEMLGGRATLGIFTQFSEHHIARAEVIADSVMEAVDYMKEVCNFADPDGATIHSCAAHEVQFPPGTNKGVVNTFPFRLLRGQEVVETAATD
jgi:hypothetical protein